MQPVAGEHRVGSVNLRMERILVGVDGSAVSGRAQVWAARLALQLPARLVLATVWTDPVGIPDAERHAQAERRRTLLEGEWSDVTRHLGVPFETELLRGDSPDALLDAAESIDAALIVIGTRGSGGFPGLRLGSFADWIAHRTTRPLAVIPEPARPEEIRRILLGLAGGEGDIWAVGFCYQLAMKVGAEVVAAHAAAASSAEAETLLEEVWTAPLRDANVTVRCRLLEDRHPGEALIGLADDEAADLILIGTRSLTGWRLLRLGGVTMQLVHASDRPVLVVPPLP